MATLVPHSLFVVVLAAQWTSVPVLGAISGAAYGASRELMALLMLARKQMREHPEVLGVLIAILASNARRFNIAGIIVVIVIGASLMIVASVPHWRSD